MTIDASEYFVLLNNLFLFSSHRESLEGAHWAMFRPKLCEGVSITKSRRTLDGLLSRTTGQGDFAVSRC